MFGGPVRRPRARERKKSRHATEGGTDTLHGTTCPARRHSAAKVTSGRVGEIERIDPKKLLLQVKLNEAPARRGIRIGLE